MTGAARRLAAAILLAGLAVSSLGACGPGGGSDGGNREETADSQSEEWFYDHFDEERKMAYDAFRIAAQDPLSGEPVPVRSEQGETKSIPVRVLDEVYQGFLFDHPEVFWLSRTYGYRSGGESTGEETADAVAVAALPESEEALGSQKEEFEDAASEFLRGVEKTENDRDKAAAIYEKLAVQTEYEEEAVYDDRFEADHTAYNVITGRRGVCDGIALAYKYLLSRCGIRCLVVPGESGGAAHVWNLVYWDGSWHETDLTWDIASDGNERMQYFDLSTEEMNKDHRREQVGIATAVPTAQ